MSLEVIEWSVAGGLVDVVVRDGNGRSLMLVPVTAIGMVSLRDASDIVSIETCGSGGAELNLRFPDAEQAIIFRADIKASLTARLRVLQ